jgi:hypothetical protein
LELPWIQTRLFVKSRSETRMWWISEVRAVASASAHAAGCRVAVSVCSEKLRQTTISSSVSGRTARQDRGGNTRSILGSPSYTPSWRWVGAASVEVSSILQSACAIGNNEIP